MKADIRYGKHNVSFYRTHPVRGLLAGRVSIDVFGNNFLPAYTEGDNREVVATDTMKNFMHTASLVSKASTLEGWLFDVGSAFLRVEMDDETANFVHWKVRGIAPAVDSVAAGAVPKGGRPGRNSFHKVGYGGPCPPPGDKPHRYAFTITAVGKGGKTLDSGSLTGTFSR